MLHVIPILPPCILSSQQIETCLLLYSDVQCNVLMVMVSVSV